MQNSEADAEQGIPKVSIRVARLLGFYFVAVVAAYLSMINASDFNSVGGMESLLPRLGLTFILFPTGIAFLVLTPIATLLDSYSDAYFIHAEALMATIWFALTIGTYGFLAWYGWAYLKTTRKEVIHRSFFIVTGILFVCLCGWFLSNFLINAYWNPASW